jgi:xylulokinase
VRDVRDDRYVLAVDLGTTGLKVGFATLTGRIVWSGHSELETVFGPEGTASQDAHLWWQLVRDAAREGLLSGAFPPEQVVAVSCTGQWASTVPVDDQGIPVGDCVLWMDQQGGRHARDRFGGPAVGYNPVALARWIRRTGGAPSLSGSDPVGHMLHLAADLPDVALRSRWYLEPVDYLTMRFTGVAAASHASMTAAWLTDNRDLDRLDYDPDLVSSAGVDPSKLPPLRRTGSVVGEVRAEVAQDLGLPDGVRVVTGVPDLHSAAVGTGALLDYEPHLAISTTSWISCQVPFKKTSVLQQIASIPGLTADRYLVADNHETAGATLRWLRDQVLNPSDGLLEGGERVGFSEMTAVAATSVPGAGSVIFTPWLAGERSPVDDRDARGGFHNLSLTTTRADLIRAVLEGVALNNRWLHDAVEDFAKRRLDRIRMFGGGATSDLWCQIHADVLDRTIERVHDPLTTNVRGAALLAGIALGALRVDEVRDLVEVDAVFHPDPMHRRVYERLYAEFPKLYKAQKGMFGRLNRRSGRQGDP